MKRVSSRRTKLISKLLPGAIFLILLILILFSIFGIYNADKNSDSIDNETAGQTVNPISIDSLKNSGYTIFKSYDFFSHKGTVLDSEKTEYPLLAVKNTDSGLNLISVMSADSIVSRIITRNTKSLQIEKVKNFRPPDEVEQTTLVFVYHPEYITVFVFAEDIYWEEEKNKYLRSLFFIYPDHINEYYQGDNDERMISDIDATDFTISENELNKVFTGSREIEKFHYNKAKYHDITNPFLLDYLMIDK